MMMMMIDDNRWCWMLIDGDWRWRGWWRWWWWMMVMMLVTIMIMSVPASVASASPTEWICCMVSGLHNSFPAGTNPWGWSAQPAKHKGWHKAIHTAAVWATATTFEIKEGWGSLRRFLKNWGISWRIGCSPEVIAELVGDSTDGHTFFGSLGT